MPKKRDILMFIAGAQSFHALVHIMLSLVCVLPIRCFIITLTYQLNFVAIIVNILAAAGLIYWARKTK